ncbi:MAG: class I tRNA ligase family protein [Candidatus Hodgkinia cicadicola]|nr:MAG: class I tRNA ligase family protein [Candidatus Hodgkinia cicadicola]
MAKFNINLPTKQKAYTNESAACYQINNRLVERAAHANRKRFELLDGPPYANGEVHIGHIINKLLKQIITTAQTQTGKKSELKSNWDCHGLPIELEVQKHNRRSANYMCKTYALNWIKAQTAQLKLVGLKSTKPQTTMAGLSQHQAIAKIYSLIEARQLTFGRKSTTWGLAENSSISDADTEQTLAETKLADVLNVVTKRRAAKESAKLVVAKLVELKLNKSYRLLNQKVLTTHTSLWSLPWTTHISLPNLGKLKLNDYKRTATISDHKAKLVLANTSKPIPVCVAKLLNTLNAFNMTSIPITSQRSNAIKTVDLTSEADKLTKLVHNASSPLTYDPVCFKRSTFSNTAGFSRGVLFVINKLITRSLLLKCYTVNSAALTSTRAKAPAVRWVSPQIYIRLDHATKANVAKLAHKIEFEPKSFKALLIKLIQTRPDWIISRQRLWGIPLCLVVNSQNKAILDHKLRSRIKQLASLSKTHRWHELKTLYNRYQKQNWKQITDVVDVWFDASLVWTLRKNTPSWDLVLEGIDQHRGWFQTTLISAALDHKLPPFKTLITHGFAMTDRNQKMSKSLHSFQTKTLFKKLTKLNTNIIRAWVCTIDPSENQTINKNWLLKPQAELAKLSNTLKWGVSTVLAANYRISAPLSSLLPIDRLVLHRLKLCSSRIKSSYGRYKINSAVNTMFAACSSLLSQYFDYLKDQIYCDFALASNRLSSVSVIRCAITQITSWLAPIAPATSLALRRKLELDNTVINELPSKWFSRRLALKWSIITKIKTFVSKLRCALVHTTSDLSVNVYVLNKSKLATFKNVSLAPAIGCAKTNIILVDHVANQIKLSKQLAVSISLTCCNRCLRCRRLLFANEF